MKPLTIPAAAQRDENAIQMLSAWIAEGGLHCAIKIGMWDAMGRNEPRAFGILLADTIRHIANATHEEFGKEPSDTIAAILESLHEELGEPTSPARGEFVSGHS